MGGEWAAATPVVTAENRKEVEMPALPVSSTLPRELPVGRGVWGRSRRVSSSEAARAAGGQGEGYGRETGQRGGPVAPNVTSRTARAR